MQLEKLKKIRLIGLAGLAFGGSFLGMFSLIKSQAYFLNIVGAGGIPLVGVVNGLVVTLLAWINYKFGRSFGSRRFLIWFLVILTIGVGVGFGFARGDGLIAEVLIYFLIAQVFVQNFRGLLNGIINSAYSPLEVKKIFSRINLGENLGLFLAPVSFELLNSFFKQNRVGAWDLVLYLGFSVVSWRIIKGIGSGYRNENPEKVVDLNQVGIWEKVKVSFNKNNYSKICILLMLLVIFSAKFLELGFNLSIEKSIDKESIGSVLSSYYLIVFVIEALMNSFGLNWVMLNIGIKKLLLFFAGFGLVGFGVLGISGLNPFGFLILMAIYTSFNSTVVALSLHEVLNISEKFNEIRGVVRGVTITSASVVLALISLNEIKHLELIVGVLTGILLIGVFVMVVKLNIELPRQLKKIALSGKKDEQIKAIDLLAEKSEKDKGENILRNLLKLKSSDDEIKIQAMNAMAEIGNEQSIIDLIELTENTNNRVKYSALDNLEKICRSKKAFRKAPLGKIVLIEKLEKILASDEQNFIKEKVLGIVRLFELDDVIRLLQKELHHKDDKRKIQALEALASIKDRAVIVYAKEFLDSQSLKLMAAACVALWQFEDMRAKLSSRIALILAKKTDQTEIMTGLYLIGNLELKWEKDYVMRAMEFKDKFINLFSQITLIKIGERSKIEDLTGILIELIEENDLALKDFWLSQYRKLSKDDKKFLLGVFSGLEEEKARKIFDLFRNNKFQFEEEIEYFEKAYAKSVF